MTTPLRFKNNTMALRQSGKLGHFKSTNKPVSFSKNTLYEHLRIVDKNHSYVKVMGNVYLVKNKDIVLRDPKVSSVSVKEQVTQYPQQMSDFEAPPQKPVSMDQVIDRYIVRYERESIPLEGQSGPGPIDANSPSGGGPMEEHAAIRDIMAFLLREQGAPPKPEDEPPPPDEDPAASAAPPAGGASDMPGDPTMGGGMGGAVGGDPAVPGGDAPPPDAGAGGPPPEGPAIANTPKINLNDFCRSIARLVNNYNALLNPRTVILNRVEAYIKSNYDERTAKHFMQIMTRNYGLHTTETEYPEGDNEFPTPYAASALLGGGGGGG